LRDKCDIKEVEAMVRAFEMRVEEEMQGLGEPVSRKVKH